MKMEFDGEMKDVELVSLSYGNDLLDGILLNMPDNYGYLSDHVEAHRDIMEAMSDERCEHFDLSDCEVDFDQLPHLWVIKSVGRMVVRAAEQACIEAWE